MSIELKPSSVGCDVRCVVCGQGFLLFSSRLAHLHLRAVQTHVQRALREQHADCDDHTVHPTEGFTMPLLLNMLLPSATLSNPLIAEENTL